MRVGRQTGAGRTGRAGPAEEHERAGEPLRVLFDIQHPAQVHLFKHAIWELERRGHRTLVASREKELTTALLDACGIEHVALTTQGRGVPGLVGELLVREVRLLSLARSFRPDVVVSRFSPAAVHAARLTGARNVVVHDTHLSPPLFRDVVHGITLPFVDRLYTPDGFEFGLDAERHRRLGYQELAYLHPNYFRPDPAVLTEYGVDPDSPYFVVRLVAWDAYHDVGHAGFSRATVADLLSLLSTHGPVYVSSESPLPPAYAGHAIPVPPHLVHHLLYYATLYVGDSGTMATEAAVLGTPAVRASSLAGPDDENVFVELEERYGLLFSFADDREALRKVEELLSAGVDREAWRARRDRLLAEQVDVTDTLVDQIVELGRERQHARQ